MNDIDWDSLPPTTVPENLPVIVQGFSNEEAAVELAKVVGESVMALGSFFDLSTLDGVTIGIDYDAALASIDQGIKGLKPLGRTETEETSGVAKAIQVMRNGNVRTHLAFDAKMLVPLFGAEQTRLQDREIAIGIIAHECGHVAINAKMDALVPDARLGIRIADFERAVLFQVAQIAWDEYAVCRLTARFARRQNEEHAAAVGVILPEARKRANQHIKAYRVHGNVHRLIAEAGGELCRPIRACAYLLGGMDAEGLTWSDFPEAHSAVEAGNYGTLIDALHDRCRVLWDTLADWSADVDVLGSLVDLSRDVFASGGIFFYQDEAGMWGVKVPFSPGTMPDQIWT